MTFAVARNRNWGQDLGSMYLSPDSGDKGNYFLKEIIFFMYLSQRFVDKRKEYFEG